jgi:tetratricopeptide (TPR) repeat protein
MTGRARLGAAALVLTAVAVVVAAYAPALAAGWIWDDDSYVWRNAVVQTPGGVLDAWVPGRTPQWYPMVFVSFWAQHALHGLDPFGYHLVNVLLHAASSLMLWRLLAALRLPGAAIAAAIFALHPMQVESVAWVTERKNVLSMAFALASVHCWLRWDVAASPVRDRAGWWGASFALFVLAMLSKTTAVAVPVAIAAIAWWRSVPGQRGGVRWAVLPYFAVGVAMGLVTAWLEATHVGASGGAEFQAGVAERLRAAAMAWWWYLWAWAVPVQRSFVHAGFPPTPWLGWLALVGGVAAAAGAWRLSPLGRRGAWVAFLTYSAGVFPALGFVNLYPLRYAPVADHFAYVASVPMAAVAGWALAAAWRASSMAPRAVRALLLSMAGAGAIALATATHAECRTYRDAETLWRATLERNPDAWLAGNNLVVIVLDRMQRALDAGDATAAADALVEAAALSERCVALAGAIDMSVQSNMSEVRRLQGRLPEALAAADAALALEPLAAGPAWQRGRLLELLGRVDEAGECYRVSVERAPRNSVHLREWVRWLVDRGRLAEARDGVRRIVELEPDDPEARANLGALELELGNVQAARRELQAALAEAPEPLAGVVAVRLVRALLAPPADAATASQARAIAGRLVELTGGADPLALLLLARSQAVAGDPAAPGTLARAERILPSAGAEVVEAARPELEAARQAIDDRRPAMPAPDPAGQGDGMP